MVQVESKNKTTTLDKDLAQKIIQAAQDGAFTQQDCKALGMDRSTCEEVQAVIELAEKSPEFLNSISGPKGMNLTKARAKFFKAEVASLRADLTGNDPYLRYLAVEELREMGPDAEHALPELIEVLSKAVSDKDKRIAKSALLTLDQLSDKAILEAAPTILKYLNTWRYKSTHQYRSPIFIDRGNDMLVYTARMLARAGKEFVPEIVKFIRDNSVDGRENYHRRCMGLIVLLSMRKNSVDISAAESTLREIEEGVCQSWLSQREDRAEKGCVERNAWHPMGLSIIMGGMDDYNLARAALGKAFVYNAAEEQNYHQYIY